VHYDEVAGGELEKCSLIFVNVIKVPRSSLQDFVGHLDSNIIAKEML